MRLALESEELDELESTKALLVRRCVAWAAEHGRMVDPEIVKAAIDCRHWSVDGRLNYWTPDEVRRLLLGWVPGHVTTGADDLRHTPESLRTFLRFLVKHGLRDPRGGTLEENEAAIDDSAGEFVDALANPKHFDVPERAFSMPPVILPSDEELSTAATQSRVVQRLKAIAEWVGESERTLTAKGALAPADARELSTLLDLPEPPSYDLELILEWAKLARIVRVSKGKLLGVRQAGSLLNDPIALWHRAFEASFELNDVICWPQWPDGIDSMLSWVYDTVQDDILSSLYCLFEPAPLIRMQMPVWKRLAESFALDDADTSAWPEYIEQDLNRMFDALADLGAIEITHGTPGEVWFEDLSGPLDENISGIPGITASDRAELHKAQSEPGKLLTMTPLGLHGMRPRLLAQGRQASFVGELANAPVMEMLGVVLDHYTDDTAEQEISIWLRENRADFEILLDAIRAMPFRSRALPLLYVLVELPFVEPELLQRLRADPLLAPYAVSLLVKDQEETDPDIVSPEESTVSVTESMLQMLEHIGPDELKELLITQHPRTDLILALHAVLTSNHPDTQAVAEFKATVADDLLSKLKSSGVNPRIRRVADGSTKHGGPRKKRRKRH